MTVQADKSALSNAYAADLDTGVLSARVLTRTHESANVIELILEAAADKPLPDWTPGSHVDIHTPHGIKQYSLCGESGTDELWRVGIQSGESAASQWLHESVQPGSTLTVGVPRNNFKLKPASSYLFIAGGIGITPLLPMIRQVADSGAAWKLIFTSSRESSFPFRRLLPNSGQHITFWNSGEQGRLDFSEVLQNLELATSVYACGPQNLTNSLLEAAEQLPTPVPVYFERFKADTNLTQGGVNEVSFEIEMARSGKTITVGASQTALDALTSAGSFIITSCREGVCGSCEVPVLSGDIDHRDSVLDDEEKANNDCFFPCVSRAKSSSLVVDL